MMSSRPCCWLCPQQHQPLALLLSHRQGLDRGGRAWEVARAHRGPQEQDRLQNSAGAAVWYQRSCQERHGSPQGSPETFGETPGTSLCGVGVCVQFCLKQEQGGPSLGWSGHGLGLSIFTAVRANDGKCKPDRATFLPREPFGGPPGVVRIQSNLPVVLGKGAFTTWPNCHPGISFQPTRVTHGPRTHVPLSSVPTVPSCQRPPQGAPLTPEDPDQVSPSTGRVRCPPRDSPSPMPPQRQSSSSSRGRSGALAPTSGDVGREQRGAGHLHHPLQKNHILQPPCAQALPHLALSRARDGRHHSHYKMGKLRLREIK